MVLAAILYVVVVLAAYNLALHGTLGATGGGGTEHASGGRPEAFPVPALYLFLGNVHGGRCYT